MTIPPLLIGHIWRPLHPLDAPALRQLLDECAFLDGAPAPQRERNIDHIETDTLAAINNAGGVAAYGWLTRQHNANEFRVMLEGRVHPDYRGRGVGAYLITWGERQAQRMGATVLQADVYDHAKNAPVPSERDGFVFTKYLTDTP